MIKIGLLGSKGKMGKVVTELIAKEFSKDVKLEVQADKGDSLEALLKTDVVVDFSSPDAVLGFIQLASQNSNSLPCIVIGSTGWKLDGKKTVEELAKSTPILMSSNFSVGLLAYLEALRTMAPIFEKLGYTPVIVESHHKHKKDSPSGTAISIQRAIAPAGPGNVQTHSIRAGEVVGDHEVTFYGPGDEIRVAHHANDRSIFARGAIEAAVWLVQKKTTPGLFSIETFFKEKIGV